MAASAAIVSRTIRLDAAVITASSQGIPGWFNTASRWESMSGGVDNPKTVALSTPGWQNRPFRDGRPGPAPHLGLYRAPTRESSDAADGEVRKAREGAARAGVQALEQRARPARLRQHLAGRVEALAGALQDGHERVPARRRLPAGEPGALRSGREVLLRRRRAASARLQAARRERLSCADPARSSSCPATSWAASRSGPRRRWPRSSAPDIAPPRRTYRSRSCLKMRSPARAWC